jgi:hypothetical protein
VPPWTAAQAAQSLAKLASTTKTSASLEDECNNNQHFPYAPSITKISPKALGSFLSAAN